MNRNVPYIPAQFHALKVVSPLMFGDDKKDQDRARWFEPGQIACVCDGVTSSPNSAEAAELAVSFAPVLFEGRVHERLAALADLLMAHRRECQQSSEVFFPKHTSEAMQRMLREVVREKRAISFQTTLVAARFASDARGSTAHVVKCGDSGFFAFSRAGELLTSSLAFAARSENPDEGPERACPSSPVAKAITFTPGDEILVRVEGQLSEHKDLAQQAGIGPEHIQNWVLCSPVDSCRWGAGQTDDNLSELKALSLRDGDRLLVPKFLYGTQLTSKGQHYRVLRYSSTIRPVLSGSSVDPATAFVGHGSTTKVLPDHFYGGGFDCFQDTFPPETHFVLCSDGFYGSFADGNELWAWLQANAGALAEDHSRQEVLVKLHSMLHAKGGDDDISFIWVRPEEPDQGRC